MNKHLHIFLLILILSISLQSWSKANGVKDFEIEGMGVGDSLLDFFSEKEIKNEIKSAMFYPNSKKFMIVSLVPIGIEQYENINFHLKANDKNYIIYSIKGLSYMETKDCLNLKKTVAQDIETLIPNARLSKHTSDYNKTMGNSKAFINDYFLSDGVIRVFCTDWDKEFLEKNENLIYDNTLSIVASNNEVSDWIRYEAYPN